MAAQMTLFHSSHAMDLQSVETVVGPLNQGIVSICHISKLLLDARVDPITGMCSNYEQIRAKIVDAEHCLKNSETMIKRKLLNLDKHMEQLVMEKTIAEEQSRVKCMGMNQLKFEKRSAEQSLSNSKEALEQAKRNVALKKKEIRKEEDKKEIGGWVTAAGIGVTMIPVAGWIVGPMIIYEGINTMEDASKAIEEAEEELEEKESQVKRNHRKVSDYQSKICNIQHGIQETDKLLNKIQGEIEWVKQHLQLTADIQEMVRRSVNLLTVLSGRVTVMERQTQRFILWEPVIKTMEDVMKAVVNIAENRLLYRHGVHGLICTLRENVGGLLSLNYSSSSAEYDNYY